MRGLAILGDLLFQSKLEAAAAHAGVELHITRDPLAALHREWEIVIIDLESTYADRDSVTLIRALRAQLPTVPIIGYCSHIEVELQAKARVAGCSQVLSRAEFVRQLPALIHVMNTEKS